jgi:branched-chain amino acid transport system substrate-binding protein
MWRQFLTATVLISWMGACPLVAHAQSPKAAISAPLKTSTDPIRIGFICPFSGSSQDFGGSARLGAELAVKEINEVGGYLGRRIELLARDDQANPDVGRRVAEELVLKDKVDFTVGFCNTGVALKSLDFFETQKHLLLIPVATGSVLTAKTPAKDSFVFRLSARDTLQAALLVEELVERRKVTKIAVLADSTGYGEGGKQDVEKFLAEKGLKPVHVARFDLQVASLVDEVQAAKAAGAEALIGYTVGPQFGLLAKARVEARFTGPLLGAWPLSFRSAIDKAGSAIEGAVMTQTIVQDISNERRSSFIARLKRHANGQSVGSLMSAAQSYDAVHLMLRVLFQTKGDMSGPALKAALENLERPYPGVITTHDKPFSSRDHDSFTRNMVWLGVWRKGEIQFYYPEDANRASIIRRKQP